MLYFITNNLILKQSTITKRCKQTCKQQDEFPHFPQQLPSEQDAKFTGPKGRSQIPAGARNHKIKSKVLPH